ncbi:ATP-dependent DNA helicase DDX11 [Phalaenopsis equestris]|uniref:ATP-dependent DNA helicase DDX11 n=1 Tax=Phalaenopsis equestris TaxID=78828 RepID=UPI0009E56861|nr:ATP-dependent DNA helicase DDX11 [Phalaenopsis equestris]
MEDTSKPRRNFPAFPFEPYSIQVDFMSFLYESLDRGGIAMLESPTGTGKTLSIICSALQWLVDRRKRQQQCEKTTETANIGDDDDEPDWMRDFVVSDAQKEEKRGKRLGSGHGDEGKKNPLSAIESEVKQSESLTGDDDVEFLLDDYESEEEGCDNVCRGSKRKGARCLDSSSSDEDIEEEKEKSPKVYFTSRTHSQLSQFVKEFKMTIFASELNLICLGSRKNLCINADVLKLGNGNRINERCLELQRNNSNSKIKVQHDNRRSLRPKHSCGCPMLRKHNLRKLFKDKIRELGALDIEDLYQLGSKIGTCPYYGSRDMIRAADLVVLPYQSLLQKSSRESLGLKLKNNIVIIDEAHNLADSLTNMYNAKITLSQLKQVLSHLKLYLDKFQRRLGAGNRRYILTLIVVTKSFLRLLLGDQVDDSKFSACLTETAALDEHVGDVSMTINEFLFSLDIDNINFVKLVHYVKESNIVHKVSGYGQKVSSQNGLGDADNQKISMEGSFVSSFQALADVLLQLTSKDSEGRIILSRQRLPNSKHIGEAYLKYVMLSGDRIFTEIMDQAHAIVLAGGTMQPIEESRVRLFPDLSIDQVQFFTCKHIVPPESILPIVVACGPSGLTFDFSYNSRSSLSMIEELGRFISNLVAIVPEGMVVFFSSFEYEGQVYSAWKASGILQKILKKKRLFREPRNNVDVEVVLREYKESISSSNGISKTPGTSGAILLAVVGGKISEGINFSDGMGRCVIMVGLPYPSLFDVELIERIKHIEWLGETSQTTSSTSRASCNFNSSGSVQSGFDILRSCKQRGKEYYENLCMKAVNQSIGRAIRHINDYAAVLLVDSRYSCNSSYQNFSKPTDKLPLWIRDRLVFATGSYGEVHKLLFQFYQHNRQKFCR